MALDTNFNVNPYYDDFDEDKKFLRVLFKPGYAVQARELTQLQTILQKQSDRFGGSSFKNGSVVTGAETFTQDATYIKLSASYLGTDIVANNFTGMTILSNDESKRAEVIRVYAADLGTGDPITLMVKQLYGDAFVTGDIIKTNENAPYYATVTGSGTGQIFSVTEGIFYYEGFFVKNSKQTIATSKYDNITTNARIGFEIEETIVKSTSDTTLLDPAQDASNYQAPGADRYKIDLILATRALDSTDTKKFIEISRTVNGYSTRTADTGVAAIIEDELARRTYDESGNYTVRPFILSLQTNEANSANMDIILSPGKAYVYGYEYGTTSPTTITIDKPRTTSNVNNRRITGDYGNYIFTSGHLGSWPINSLATVDLHCVPNSSINVTTTATISNTKIGTARVKSLAFDSSTNTANVATYTYKTFLFDVNVNNSITGNINAASVTSTTIPIGNVTAGQVFSTIPDAYKGAKLRIIAGPGTGEAAKFINGFTGTTASQNLTIASAFTATLNTQSKFSIDFEFNDCDSLATFSGTNRINAATIENRSKLLTSTYVDAFISDSTYEPLIFPVGQPNVAPGTIADFSYTYRRLFEGVSFSGVGATVDSTALTVESGANLASAITDSTKLEKYQVVVTSVGSSPYTLYQTVPVANVTAINTTTRTITVAVANNMTANITATIDYTLASGSPAKSKSFVNPSSTIQTTSGEVINSSGVIVYASSGQTTIQANNIIRTPDTLQSLYVPDVIELISVYDFNGGTVANTGYTDVTYKYTLETGQKDSFYDHSSIKLKSGYAAPIGPIVTRYRAYSSTSSGGFFSADSYPTYATIPTYASKSSGVTYKLRDCLDYRPVRKAATAAIGTAVEFDVNPSTYGPKIPKYGSDILLDYSYYLPRIDKLVLNKNKYFEIVKGIPAINPIIPSDKQDTMNLYLLSEPAYVANTSDVTVTYFNNRRYTMRDIGSLDSRITNLEYYTSLSLLEQDAINMQDSTTTFSANLQRFKNGIVVDSFKGHSVADVTALDYQASIDVTKQELRPTFNITSAALNFDSSNSSNYLKTGPFITVTASNTAFVDQKLASRSLNINPFNVVNYIGKISLNPPSDIWVDTTRKPDVTVNLGGDKDAWALIDQVVNNSAFVYEWGSWQNTWSGTSTSTTRQGSGRLTSNENSLTTTTTTTQAQTRNGILSQIVPETITKSIGDRVVDVSIIPYMRAKTVLFVGTDFKPDTVMYPFFDGTPVEQYVAQANRVVLQSNNLNYRTSVGNEESVQIKNSGGTVIGTAVVVKTSNNSAFIVNNNPSAAYNSGGNRLVGTSSGTDIVLNSYYHYSGFAAATTSTTITLAIDASGASNSLLYGNTVNSNIISIVFGPGAGQQRTISSYNGSTRIATISTPWTTLPNSSSVYSIGRLTTTRSGDTAGIFNIPASIFRVGEKQFRLVDNSVGDIPSSSTNGDASFYAQGLLETTENTIVSTIQPSIQRTSVADSRVTSTTSSITTPIAGWWDPLAQTFLISPAQYSQGLFIEKIRVCFKTKHDSSPVTLQLRPVVNGYPSSTTVYPYGSVTLTPDKVKVTDSPNLDDATKYTDFVFDAPVYMLPGEHTFVLLSNSNGYEAYAAEIGKLDLVTGLQISEQPYGGSLFKSQNGSTWTADENMDMMFRLYRKDFSTSTTSTVQFLIDKPSSNVVFDVLNLTTSQIALANTVVNYSFLSEKITGGTTNYYSINSNEDYEMIEGDGRRVLNPTSGNNTFILKATMSTANPHISPVLDTTRFGGLFIENIVNSLPLLNTGFSITTAGTGYTGNTKVTISGGGGSGANAYAVANVTTGNITSIVVDVGGTGYTTSPTITISAPPVTGGNTTSVVAYNGEDKKTGGNSVTRYMTRRVTLNDGFDSGDLRVYLTGYKPSGSNIYIYYKLLSRSDSDSFESKNYQLMTEIGNGNFVSQTKNDYRELVFAPGITGIANNSVSYTTDASTFKSFKTFSIKIVMSGTNTTNVPKVRDIRAVALPAL
jgi:hypothetical protein